MLLVLAAVAGCQLNPSRVTAVPSQRDFSALSCDQLKAESTRLDSAYLGLRWSNEAGTRNKIARLNGETKAVNDSIRIQSCDLPSVRIPGSAWPETRGGYQTSSKQ